MFAGSICRPTSNTLLSVADHCLKSTGYINVIVSDKQKHLQYMTMDEAIEHCTKGIGIWQQGEQRRRLRTGCGDGLCGRHSNERGSGRGSAVCASTFPISRSAS